MKRNYIFPLEKDGDASSCRAAVDFFSWGGLRCGVRTLTSIDMRLVFEGQCKYVQGLTQYMMTFDVITEKDVQ